ncbi:hypothetical protein [Paenibacillus sp. FSL R7-0652]|jgi:hypothetical protein|uniref:hypothetical protein n=1 Tax=Paenibacillus sp. FSL R7-0652 TaxID=2921687 RepID=UPI00315A4493
MADFVREVNSLVQKRENLHPDDPAIQLIWHDLVNLLKSNEESAIAFLEQRSKETELYWLCEIFEDLSAEFQSRAFIHCLLELQKKYPDLDMKQDIEYAIQSIEE